jgi:hypothetical protein
MESAFAKQTRKKSGGFYSLEQTRMLLGTLTEPCASVVSIAVLTGMKIGEILALRWKRIDLLGATLEVAETYSSGEFGPPKTKSSRRAIPISSALRRVLEAQRARANPATPEEPIFQTPNGTPLSDKKGQHSRNRSRHLIFDHSWIIWIRLSSSRWCELAAAIGLMAWMELSAMIVLLGAAWNTESATRLHGISPLPPGRHKASPNFDRWPSVDSSSSQIPRDRQITAGQFLQRSYTVLAVIDRLKLAPNTAVRQRGAIFHI